MASQSGISESSGQCIRLAKSDTNTGSRQVDPDMSDKTDSLLPFYLAYLGGNWSEAIQCIEAGDNGYDTNQASLNHGLNNHWARNNSPWSWGYHKREDIPVHFALAEGWTSGDMYQVRVTDNGFHG